MLPRTDAGRVHPRPRSVRVTASIGPIAVAGSTSVRMPLAAAPASHVAQGSAVGSAIAGASAHLEAARSLGTEAARAAAAARQPGDVEGVLLATRKADAAFRMLEAARNAMLDAYARMGDLG